MSDTQQGPDWWYASDGKWYPPNESRKDMARRVRKERAQAKRKEQMQAVLEPGEQIQALFNSQTGVSPRSVVSWAPLVGNIEVHWVVAVTDRNIVIIPLVRKGKPARLPREPLEILEEKSRRWWFPVKIGGKRHYVNTLEYEVVAGINKSLRAEQGAPVLNAVTEPTASTPDQPSPSLPAAWYPDPTGRHEQRYWDGQGWSPHVADQGAQSTDPVEAP
jgi:Protein of unknown function (DUF2510)